MSKHRILVLGGGYTGVLVAGQLARRMRRDEASVTLVTDHATRNERMRWHQLATGQRYPLLSIEDALAGSGADLRVATIERIDTGSHAVIVSGGETVPYDSVVIALGSVIDFGSVPGALDNAHGLTDAASVHATSKKLEALPDGTSVVVVGGGLTGIELATEVAESYPRLRVTITSPRSAGDWLSEPGQRHLRHAFERLGIEQVLGRVSAIGPDAVTFADGHEQSSALTFWAGGFRANALSEASGIAVDELGRAYVDERLRSVSDPAVWVIGDAARVPGPDGTPLKMGCRTGAFMALAGPQKVADSLAGVAARPFTGRYFAECISLGRHDALLQWLTRDGTATGHVITGRAAVTIKEYVHRGNLFAARHPGPYTPSRRSHVQPSARGRREMIGA
ncbi:NAD(P)/FAD-dependent oxidoreductase [Rathayibacter soli]|uniref:NAD(P)/FAD-dependent oxidoreductase n=1 Tax=Rathayibacter soli TaxID=3144168 RepID=UPI0027E45F97|nr:FAD-dependent oxidoreductase [Glaciibacter superstes]